MNNNINNHSFSSVFNSRPVCSHLQTSECVYIPSSMGTAGSTPYRMEIKSIPHSLDIKQTQTPQKKYAILVSPRIYPQKSAHHVSFNQTDNKTVYINGKDFYQHNNIKHHIWWSQQELAVMRSMFLTDLQQVIASNPNKTPKECILELLERA